TPIQRHSRRVEIRELRRVTADHVKRLPVRREEDRMNAVLAAAVELAQQFDFIEAVVAVGIAHAIKTAAGVLVDHDVEAVERVEESVRLADWHIDGLV